jgi:hypothetical protein
MSRKAPTNKEDGHQQFATTKLPSGTTRSARPATTVTGVVGQPRNGLVDNRCVQPWHGRTFLQLFLPAQLFRLQRYALPSKGFPRPGLLRCNLLGVAANPFVKMQQETLEALPLLAPYDAVRVEQSVDVADGAEPLPRTRNGAGSRCPPRQRRVTVTSDGL